MWGIAETLAWMVSKECLDDQRVCINSGGCVWQGSLSLIFRSTNSPYNIFTLSASLCKPHAFSALKNQRNTRNPMNLFLISWTSPRGQPLARILSSLQSTLHVMSSRSPILLERRPTTYLGRNRPSPRSLLDIKCAITHVTPCR